MGDVWGCRSSAAQGSLNTFQHKVNVRHRWYQVTKECMRKFSRTVPHFPSSRRFPNFVRQPHWEPTIWAIDIYSPLNPARLACLWQAVQTGEGYPPGLQLTKWTGHPSIPAVRQITSDNRAFQPSPIQERRLYKGQEGFHEGFPTGGSLAV